MPLVGNSPSFLDREYVTSGLLKGSTYRDRGLPLTTGPRVYVVQVYDGQGFISSLTLGGGGSGLVCVYWAPGVSICDLRIQGSQDAHVCWGWVPEERFCMVSAFKC